MQRRAVRNVQRIPVQGIKWIMETQTNIEKLLWFGFGVQRRWGARCWRLRTAIALFHNRPIEWQRPRLRSTPSYLLQI